MTTGLLVFALANLAVALSDAFTLTLILRIVAGLTAAVVSPTCMAIAGMAAPEGRSGRYLAVVTAGLTVALFTGVPFGAFLGHAISWRATFALIALVSVVVLVLCHFMAPAVPGGTTTGLGARLAPVRNSRVLCLVVAMLLSGAGGLMFYNYLGGHLHSPAGLVGVWSIFAWALSPVMQAGIMTASPDQPMLAMSLGISGLYGGSAVGAAIGGYLLDQHGPSSIPIMGTVFLAIAVASAVLGTHPVTTVTSDPEPVPAEKPAV